MEHAFGSGEPFTVGIEEELLLVEAESKRLAHVAEQVLPAMRLPEELAGYEAYAAELELRSPPSASASEAVEWLARGRAAARRAGAALMGAGLHPAAEHGDVRFVEAERYRRVAGEMRGLLRRTPECALHVHVGMPDPEAAVRAYNGLRGHLPLLQGLAANSPFWFGQDSGMASARAALVRAYPGRGVPRAFRDFEDYASAVAAVADAGGPPDYTLLWWDLRPHPRLGTVELRELDSQSRIEDVAAIAALARALARREVEDPSEPVPNEAIAWSAFRAVRDGIDAEIWSGASIRPVRDVAIGLLERFGGDEPGLEGVERILRDGGGAGRQRAAHAGGGLTAVLEMLVDETV